MSFRATVESMSKIMDDMGITELDLERQFLFGVYRKHIHLSKGTAVAMPTFPADKTIKNSTIKQYFSGIESLLNEEEERLKIEKEIQTIKNDPKYKLTNYFKELKIFFGK